MTNISAGKPNPDKKEHSLFLKTFNFAIEFGFMVAVPLISFVYLGKFLDGRYNSGNKLYIYLGIVMALITTTALFIKKIRDIMKDMDQ